MEVFILKLSESVGDILKMWNLRTRNPNEGADLYEELSKVLIIPFVRLVIL